MSNPITVRNPLAYNRPVDVSAILAAISDLADLDRDLPGEVATSFNCTEVDALASVLAAAGHYDAAADWIEAHSKNDEEGDTEGHLHVQSLIGDNGLGGDEAQRAALSYSLDLVTQPATDDARPGVTFTRDQVEAWVGFSLTDENVADLEEALPNSSLPDCVHAVATEALGIADPAEAAGFSVGDRVVSTDYGYSGEVTAIHATCPMGAAQQMGQQVPLDAAAIAAPWLSVRPDSGGSAWVPTTRLRHEDADDRARQTA